MSYKAYCNEAKDAAVIQLAQTVKLRRWFHMHPELGLQEHMTADRICRELDGMGIPYTRAGDTGVVAVIQGQMPGPCIALRSDMDALAVQELNSVEYRSLVPRVMHACGHDGHMAALLTAGNILQQHRKELAGSVRLIFEPAEEMGYGAERMLASGLLKEVQAFFGLHFVPDLPAGKISLSEGAVMAGSSCFTIDIEGKSGHGAKPHQARDALAASCVLVQSLQQLISREMDPVTPTVLTVGVLRAGEQGNVIANHAHLEGTVRIVDESLRQILLDGVKRVSEHVAAAHRVEAQVTDEYATPVLYNHSTLYPVVQDAVEAIGLGDGICSLPVALTADDFAFYSRQAPVFYAKVGCGGPGVEAPLHSAHFMMDENGLAIAAGLYAAFVYRYLDGFA